MFFFKELKYINVMYKPYQYNFLKKIKKPVYK